MVSQGGAGSFDSQGPAAEAMADLWWLMLGLGRVVFIVFAVLLGLGLFRRRPAAEPRGGRPTTGRFGRWIVVWGVALPLVVLVVVFGATVQAMRVVPTTAPPGALVVEIVGHQSWWEVRYPAEGITTANELHIPVGRAVALQSVFLSALLTFARAPWYPGYAATTTPWGLEPLADQQLAGVIMWIPAGLIYLAAGLTLMVTWIRSTERDDAMA